MLSCLGSCGFLIVCIDSFILDFNCMLHTASHAYADGSSALHRESQVSPRPIWTFYAQKDTWIHWLMNNCSKYFFFFLYWKIFKEYVYIYRWNIIRTFTQKPWWRRCRCRFQFRSNPIQATSIIAMSMWMTISIVMSTRRRNVVIIPLSKSYLIIAN